MDLDFVIVSDVQRMFYPQYAIKGAFAAAGAGLRLTFVQEIALSNPRSFPDTFSSNALLYIHGAGGSGYQNISLARKLAEIKKEMLLIVHTDPWLQTAAYFNNRSDYDFTQVSLQQGLHPRYQLGISADVPVDFFCGKKILQNKEQVEYSLEQYLRELKRMRADRA